MADILEWPGRTAPKAQQPNTPKVHVPHEHHVLQRNRAGFLQAWSWWCERQTDPALVRSELEATISVLRQIAVLVGGVEQGEQNNGHD